MKKQLTKAQWETAVEKWERIRDGYAEGKAVKVGSERCSFCEVWKEGAVCSACPLEQAAVCSGDKDHNGDFPFWQLVTLSKGFGALDGLVLKASVAQSAVLADTILTAVKAAEPDDKLDALIASGSAYCLYDAGRCWPNSRYSPRILDALLATCDARRLYDAGREWSDARYSPRILDALIASGSAQCLYDAGRDWPDGRYSPRILAALLASGSAQSLNEAGCCWPAERYSKDALTAAIVAGWEKKEVKK